MHVMYTYELETPVAPGTPGTFAKHIRHVCNARHARAVGILGTLDKPIEHDRHNYHNEHIMPIEYVRTFRYAHRQYTQFLPCARYVSAQVVLCTHHIFTYVGGPSAHRLARS